MYYFAGIFVLVHMTTIINQTPASSDGGSAGTVIAVVVLLAVVVALLYYGLPRLRGNQEDSTLDVHVNLPTSEPQQTQGGGY